MRKSWLVVCVTLALSACTRAEDVVVAEAGGHKIRMRHLLQEAAVARARGEALDDPHSQTLARFYNAATEALIDQILLAREAERRGLKVPDSLVDAEMNRLRGEQSTEQWRRVLASYHMSEADLRDRLLRGLLIERLREELAREVRVSETDVRSYYRENAHLLKKPARARLLTLWMPRQAADAVARRWRAGAPIRELQASYRARVLELQLTEDDASFPGRTEVLRSRPGEVLGPFLAAGEAIVVKVLSVDPARPMTFQEARSLVEQRLVDGKVSAALARLARDLRSRHGFRIFFRFRGTPPPEAYPVGSP
ncbi:Chaperone SurA [bacterium HR32]|nr:Chaperone SurA [bacterium HR32]